MPHDLDGLRAKLAELDARAADVEAEAKLLRDAFAAMDKPFRDREKAIKAERDATLELHETYEVGQCEGCSKLIFEGERYHVCGDGPYLCEDCSPSWADILAHLRDRQGDPLEDAEEIAEGIATAEAMIAAGKGDEKVC